MPPRLSYRIDRCTLMVYCVAYIQRTFLVTVHHTDTVTKIGIAAGDIRGYAGYSLTGGIALKPRSLCQWMGIRYVVFLGILAACTSFIGLRDRNRFGWDSAAASFTRRLHIDIEKIVIWYLAVLFCKMDLMDTCCILSNKLPLVNGQK